MQAVHTRVLSVCPFVCLSVCHGRNFWRNVQLGLALGRISRDNRVRLGLVLWLVGLGLGIGL